MAEQIVKVFSSDLQKNLFPDNAFYKSSKLDAGAAVTAKTVEVPQSGAEPTISVNPAVFPLTASQRTDDTKTYSIDLFATTPIHIEDENEVVTNYSKRMDILSDHINSLNTKIADNMANAWGATVAANKLAMTGTARPSALAGTTGDRKGIAYADLVSAMELMDRQDVPHDGRNIVVDSQGFADLLKLDQFISFDYNNMKPVVSGQVGEILGMRVFKRSRTLVYDNANAKAALGDAVAATDNSAALIWHQNFVRRAEGTVKVYSEIDSPLYLGSIFAAAVRNGGMASRADEKGVISLIEAAAV